jgi:hypothetical protein
MLHLLLDGQILQTIVIFRTKFEFRGLKTAHGNGAFLVHVRSELASDGPSSGTSTKAECSFIGR